MGNGESTISSKTGDERTHIQSIVTKKTLDLRREFFTEPPFKRIIKYGNFSANVFNTVESYDTEILKEFKDEFAKMGYKFNWVKMVNVSPWYVAPGTNEIINEEYIFTCSKLYD